MSAPCAGASSTASSADASRRRAPPAGADGAVTRISLSIPCYGQPVPPTLPLDHASVFFAGQLSEPQLNHPEGVAVDAEGRVWCGGTAGEIYRLAPDGSALELVASTGGYALG